MRLIQYLNNKNKVTVGIVESSAIIRVLNGIYTMLELAAQALENQVNLEALVVSLQSAECLNYQELLENKRVLSPIHHPDSSHLTVSGTGLTHLGSADTRDAMHTKLNHADEKNDEISGQQLSDSMLMFQLGLKQGKPQSGEIGVQPEWFYKGDGSIIAKPEGDLVSPWFALDGSEEPEIVGVYIIADDSTPWRIGYCLGNEFSDHVMEQQNYLYLAHSKLRPCALGPELLLGDLPKNIVGRSCIHRVENNNQEIIWEKEFLSGEENMSHSIENLETHHFKYNNFLKPGDIHVHFFGTGTLSFGDGIETKNGDVFEIECETFGRALRNKLVISEKKEPLGHVKKL